MTEKPPTVDVDLRMHESSRWACLTVDHARRLNVLNSPLLERFAQALGQLRAQVDLRWVVITGAGEKAFIGGADIHEMASLDPQTGGTFIRKIHEACAALRQLPVPTIARIDGYCLGAGLEIAASCDLRVASDRSWFGMPEVHVGVPSVVEAALLPGLIGWGRTRELLLTGRRIDANTACQWGLVERVVPAGELDDVVQDWGSGIAAAGPQAIRLQKELIQRWEQLPLAEAIEAGASAFARAFETDEPRAAMQRFLNRRRQA